MILPRHRYMSNYQPAPMGWHGKEFLREFPKMEQADLFVYGYGTEPHKLARRDGPDTSKEAAQSVNTNTAEAMVHRAIHRFGPNGCIVADLFALASNGELGKHAYSFTARLSGLQNKGFITAGPDTRPGPSGRQQRVMRSIREPAK